MLTNPVYILLWRDLAIFLLFGALLGVLLGLLLIFKPQYMERINRVANRWFSTRHISRWLDRSVSIESWFYRHHRAGGIVIVLGGLYLHLLRYPVRQGLHAATLERDVSGKAAGWSAGCIGDG